MPHVRHPADIERADIHHLQILTALEHRHHLCHLTSVERAQVERLQRPAQEEHIAHVRHILRVEVLQSLDALHIRQTLHHVRFGVHSAVEHVPRRSQRSKLHRWVDDGLGNFLVVAREANSIKVSGVVQFGRALTGIHMAVTVIGQCPCRFHELGIDLLCLFNAHGADTRAIVAVAGFKVEAFRVEVHTVRLIGVAARERMRPVTAFAACGVVAALVVAIARSGQENTIAVALARYFAAVNAVYLRPLSSGVTAVA